MADIDYQSDLFKSLLCAAVQGLASLPDTPVADTAMTIAEECYRAHQQKLPQPPVEKPVPPSPLNLGRGFAPSADKEPMPEPPIGSGG